MAVNTSNDNLPATVGRPMPGVEVRLAASGELLVRGANAMLGYWRNPAATAAAIDPEGWLHTGDQARIDAEGRITVTGRLKEIIVLANGEKVPPEEMETAIAVDPLFEQVCIVGEGRPYLAALVVLNEQEWRKVATATGAGSDGAALEQELLARISGRISRFPGYARVRRVHASTTPWGVGDGLLTATLKLRRRELAERFRAEIEELYGGH